MEWDPRKHRYLEHKFLEHPCWAHIGAHAIANVAHVGAMLDQCWICWGSLLAGHMVPVLNTSRTHVGPTFAIVGEPLLQSVLVFGQLFEACSAAHFACSQVLGHVSNIQKVNITSGLAFQSGFSTINCVNRQHQRTGPLAKAIALEISTMSIADLVVAQNTGVPQIIQY